MKKSFTILIIIVSAIAIGGSAFNKTSVEDEVPYPEGYRMWTHVKTGLIGPGNPNFKFSGGHHHIYANAKGLQGYNSGNFPEGSILIFDVLDTKEQNGNIQEGSRKHLDVMAKDSLKYTTTGGWGFEEFSGDSHTERRLTPTVKIQCFNCHAKKTDYVFSEFRK
jgi:hypothetical protein